MAIPNDLAACQTLLADLSRTVDEQSQKLDAQSRELASGRYLVESQSQAISELDAKVKQLEEREKEYQLTIQELLQRAFARRSERYLQDPRQLQLDFQQIAGAAEAAEALAEAVDEAGLVVKQHVRHKQKKCRSEQLPEHLMRKGVRIL